MLPAGEKFQPFCTEYLARVDCYIFEILEQMNISLQWHEEVLRPGYHFIKNTSPEMFVLLTFESHCK